VFADSSGMLAAPAIAPTSGELRISSNWGLRAERPMPGSTSGCDGIPATMG